MAVKTVAFVVGNFESKVFEVVDKVKQAISQFTTTNILGRGVSASTTLEIHIDSVYKMIRFSFKVNGEERILTAHFGYPHDYKNIYEGDKLIFSMGTYGIATEIIQAVVKQFEEKRYMTENDGNKEFEKVLG